MRSPVADNPLETRDDLQRAVVQLFERLKPHASPGNARVRPGVTGALYPDVDAEFEGFSRPLWGITPLVAGGGSFDDWDFFRTGLANGTDPDHDEYWGDAGDYSQKHVEMAAIGVTLSLLPDRLWDPLSSDEQRRIADWLTQINDATLPDCNWLYFRVLTNLGLRNVGADHDWDIVEDDLARLDSYYEGDGWYADGTDDDRGARDYYVAWAMHVYGLLYAELADDPERAARYRDRAREFATEFVHWFADDGRGLPYGRSLTYRFAQASFWGALAFADAKPESLSWGQIKGLWWRNVRWWFDQPIFTNDGILSIGYRYPNLKMAEVYNSPSAPYWALKAAFPLALAPDHPFWQADEEPLPDLPATTVQEAPDKIICRDEATDHHYSLAAGQSRIAEQLSTDHEKYNKFAYSTEFGFSVGSRRPGLAGAGHDSTLALAEDGRHYRLRETVTEQSVTEDRAYSEWHPFGDVTVETWLVPVLPWHVRVHRIDADRRLHSAEGGFALDRTGDHDPDKYEHQTSDVSAIARYPAGSSGIRDPAESDGVSGPIDDREGSVVDQEPNTNLLHQRTVVPTLTGVHESGETWLTSAVIATADPDIDLPWGTPPKVDIGSDGFTVTDADGSLVYEENNVR